MSPIPSSDEISLHDEVENFVNRFRYVPDLVDNWSLLAPGKDGLYYGDCEDFAYTYLWIYCGKSLWKMWWMILTFQAVVWNVTTKSGELHAALWIRKKGWICNIYPKWERKTRHDKNYPYVAPLLAMTLLLK